jgi:formylglycine-generating enzyme required for sulfatase activity
LLLSLGEFGEKELSPGDREGALPALLGLYRNDPDPGIHGAAAWLLRRWKQGKKLKEIDRELATGTVEGNRGWYVTGQGQTLAVIAGPVEVRMGSSAAEKGRVFVYWAPYRARIGRSFAVATTEVTVEEFKRFAPWFDWHRRFSPAPEGPLVNLTWYEAAAYCNWLSKQEGLPETEWCYLPTRAGKYEEGMKLAPDYLRRTGYRLPTEAEWEYACRAGAATSRYYGQSEELLGKYAWTMANAGNRARPVGSLKPNDLGLFDMLGSAWELTQDNTNRSQQRKEGTVIDDQEGEVEVNDKLGKSMRGSSFLDITVDVRAVSWSTFAPTYRANNVGFRVARTLHRVLDPKQHAKPFVAPRPPTPQELARLPSPLDGRKRADIPPELLALAGGGDPARAPPELVAVLKAEGHLKPLYVAFSPDGKTLASSSSQDATIKLWDLATGKLRRTLAGHGRPVFALAFSPDGQTLASPSEDRTIKLWEVATGKGRQTLTGHTAAVIRVAFSPDGKALASTSFDGTLRLWDVATGKHLRTFTGHRGGLYGVAFSPDGKTLVTSGEDRTVRLWDPSGRELGVLPGHKDTVRGLAFHPAGLTLASASNDKTIRLWDLARWKAGRDNPPVQVLEGHDGVVTELAWRADGRLLASHGHDDGTVRLWDVTRTPPRCKVLRLFPAGAPVLHGVAFSPEGRYLATANLDGTIYVLRLAKPGEVLRVPAEPEKRKGPGESP